MQAEIKIELDQPLVLPINYNHILQSIIYKAISAMPLYSEFLHDIGFMSDSKIFRLFQFSQLKGKYSIENKHIIFKDVVFFEVRSPDALMIQVISRYIRYYGITFGEVQYSHVYVHTYDYTVESPEIHVRMQSPITVYTTNQETKYTTYYTPFEEKFYSMIEDNFSSKYNAYYDVFPSSGVTISPYGDKEPKKFITNYQGTIIVGWYGEYILKGERKYLDFLYQTGLGSKNSQGFGMFQIL